GTAGRGLALSASCAALALVAVAVRVPLHPVCVSYLFLALTLLLLECGTRQRSAGATWVRAYWPLLLLFALWVNCDSWFLLGPAPVAPYLPGQALAAGPGRRPADVGGLALLIPLAVAAGLLNPWHVRAFTPPVELGWFGTSAVLRHEGTFRSLFTSL